MTPVQGPAPLARELSPSELRVLRFLPTNLSRTQIAGELCISLNTVNTHVRRIYAKLGADDRSSAVRRARELRLLAAGRTRLPGGHRILAIGSHIAGKCRASSARVTSSNSTPALARLSAR